MGSFLNFIGFIICVALVEGGTKMVVFFVRMYIRTYVRGFDSFFGRFSGSGGAPISVFACPTYAISEFAQLIRKEGMPSPLFVGDGRVSWRLASFC